MSTKINISIPKPCHENWQEMTLVNKGRFCASCQKSVIDFTHLSDREIIKSFEKNENLCGRFLNTQLNRELIKPKEKSSIWLATSSAIVSFIGFGSQEVFSQESVKSEQTDKKTINENLNTTNSNQEITITGIVTSVVDSLTIPGVNVSIKGTSFKTQTDFDGKFKIKAKEGDILVFSSIGAKTIEVEILKNYNLNVIMEEDSYLLEDVIVGSYSVTSSKKLSYVGTPKITKNRTFFGRTFHSIGNWFK